MYNGPERKPLRLKQYDYSQNGFYFVTICTKNRENYFGEIVDGKIILNEYGKIAEKCFLEIKNHYQNVELDEFIIMPNHFHGIIIVGNEYFRSESNSNNRNENIRSLQKANLSNIIKGFKIGVTKEIRTNFNDITFSWQKSFFDVIIKNDDELNKTKQYIIDNPLKREFDKNNSINF